MVALKLPLLAVEKRKRKIQSEHCPGEYSMDQPAPLEVLGVIRKKIIFKTRPKPSCNMNRIKDE